MKPVRQITYTYPDLRTGVPNAFVGHGFMIGDGDVADLDGPGGDILRFKSTEKRPSHVVTIAPGWLAREDTTFVPAEKIAERNTVILADGNERPH